MKKLGSVERPVRVAIVGSGPSGFYAADALLKAEPAIQVDMWDRLPTPFGLVRGGVAPDHFKIKSVTRVYEKIAANPNFAFYGNVKVGEHLPVPVLHSYYDAVLFACGAETDRRLGVHGEDLPGSHTATEFVGWYNGHPDYADHVFDLGSESACIIGQGNVAIDVARILGKSVDELKNTDIASHALEALAESKVREIHLIGRRGPTQAKFTDKELRELGQLEHCSTLVDKADFDLDPASLAELNEENNRHAQNNMVIFEHWLNDIPEIKPKTCILHFLKSPIEIKGDDRVEKLVLCKNRLEGEPFRLRAISTTETETIDCGLVFRSIGYRGVPIPDVPFDPRRGVIPNQHGRIAPGLYAAGWIKRGPSGVIGTNRPDSAETVKMLIDDIPLLTACPHRKTSTLLEKLAREGRRIVTWEDWEKIDTAEQAAGQPLGKPREKFSRIDDMLALLD